MDLVGFYRAKVVNVSDSQLSGIIGVHVSDLMGYDANIATDNNITIGSGSKNIESKMILAIPANYYDNGVYATNIFNSTGGTYNTPSLGSYTIVFFLNGDKQKCYYLPGFSLPESGESIPGVNLDLEDKIDFYNVYKKHMLKITEFWNRDIVGVNTSNDKRHFFIIFDNGSELHFRSPNQENVSPAMSSIDNHSSFEVYVKRYDSRYSGEMKINAGNTESSMVLNVGKNYNNSEHGTEYLTLVNSMDAFNYNKNTVVHDDNISDDTTITYKLDEYTVSNVSEKKNISRGSIDLMNNAMYKDNDKIMANNTTSVNMGSDYNIETIEKKFTQDNKKTRGTSYKQVLKLADVLFNNTTNVTNTLSEKYKTVKNNEILLDYSGAHIKNNINFTNMGDDRKYSVNTVENMDMQDDKVISSILIDRSQVDDDSVIDKIYRSFKIDDSVLNATSTIKTNTGEITKISTIDKSNEIVKTNWYTVYKDPNYLDTNEARYMGATSTRGLEFVSETTLDKAYVGLHSVKDSAINGAYKASMGAYTNVLEYYDEDVYGVLNVSLGAYDGGDEVVGLKMSSDMDGVVDIRIPDGVFNVKSKTGTIKIISKDGEMYLEARDIHIKGDNINIKADDTIDMSATDLNFKAVGSVNIKSNDINLGGSSAYKKVLSGSYLLNLIKTHVHPTSAGPTGVPVVQLVDTLAQSTNVTTR